MTSHASWEICMQVKKQTLEPDIEQQTGSKLGKKYVSQKSFVMKLKEESEKVG